MKSIKKEITNEIIINKSKFITIITPFSTLDNFNTYLNNIKKTYPNATHYCYGYIINNHEKCSDNGEPSGTAGNPILNVLKQNDLKNILCVVIRYFGGIKLGAGGLIRAYSTSASEALNKCEIINLTKGYEITYEFDYNNIKKINYLLKNINIKKTFENKIIYEFKINENELKKIENELNLLGKIKNKRSIMTF